MTVAFTSIADHCDLMWRSNSGVTNAVGDYAINFASQEAGTPIAWSVSSSDGLPVTISISVAGSRLIDGFGGQPSAIYSPANLPPVTGNETWVVTGTAVAATTVTFNLLLRRQ